MKYRVGQILFAVLNKKMQVYPMMVVEEITKKTLYGEETNYVLQGGSDHSSTILLDKVEGEIFESAEEAKYVLTTRATSRIEQIVDSAVEKAAEWYQSKEKDVSDQVMSLQTQTSQVETADAVKVELPDGTIANLKMGLVG
jgi:hypothetical protein